MTLEIEEDLRTQERIWLAERIGWCVLAVFVAGGVSGLLGDGPASRVVQPFGGADELSYERFLHNDTQTDLKVPAGNGPDGSAWLSLSMSFLNRVHIDRIEPEPARTIVTAATTRFVFPPGAIGQRHRITISYTPSGAGVLNGEIAGGGGRPARIRQFVYP